MAPKKNPKFLSMIWWDPSHFITTRTNSYINSSIAKILRAGGGVTRIFIVARGRGGKEKRVSFGHRRARAPGRRAGTTTRCATVWYGAVWYGILRYGLVRHGTVRCGMVRYGTVRYGTIWYDAVQNEVHAKSLHVSGRMKRGCFHWFALSGAREPKYANVIYIYIFAMLSSTKIQMKSMQG